MQSEKVKITKKEIIEAIEPKKGVYFRVRKKLRRLLVINQFSK